jgi:hypothetical protein
MERAFDALLTDIAACGSERSECIELAAAVDNEGGLGTMTAAVTAGFKAFRGEILAALSESALRNGVSGTRLALRAGGVSLRAHSAAGKRARRGDNADTGS